MIVKSLLILVTLIAISCTSNDEAVPAASEPVAPESAEPTDKPAEEAPAAAETTPTTPEVTDSEPAPSTEAPAAQPAASVEGGDYYIGVTHLNVRSGPGMANAPVEVLTFNTPVQSLGVENRIWVKIGEGRYVSKNYLSEQKLSEPMQVQAASQPAPTEAPVETEAAPAAEEPVTEQVPEPAPADSDKEEAPAEAAPEEEDSKN